MPHESFALSLELEQNYAFTVQFDDERFPPLLLDEPEPLGESRGPNAARLIGAAVGNCLGASLLFCLRKAHVDVEGLRVDVTGELIRNERGRLRIGALHVTLDPQVADADRLRIGSVRVELHPATDVPPERLERCLGLFEDFCIVTESVRRGIDVDVSVQGSPVPTPSDG